MNKENMAGKLSMDYFIIVHVPKQH